MRHYRKELEPTPSAESQAMADRVVKAVHEIHRTKQKNGRLYDGDFCRVASKHGIKMETIKTVSCLQSQEDIQFRFQTQIVW